MRKWRFWFQSLSSAQATVFLLKTHKLKICRFRIQFFDMLEFSQMSMDVFSMPRRSELSVTGTSSFCRTTSKSLSVGLLFSCQNLDKWREVLCNQFQREKSLLNARLYLLEFVLEMAFTWASSRNHRSKTTRVRFYLLWPSIGSRVVVILVSQPHMLVQTVHERILWGTVKTLLTWISLH